MKNTTAIIICAGDATRWANYLNKPKHLIEIEGEPILNRTVRLLKERGITDIHVVSKDDPRYQIPGANQYIAKLNPENKDADKFLSSNEIWNTTGRTIIFYGDCYFSEEAMNTIVNHTDTDYRFFCRPDASEITGTPWGEIFAISFFPEFHGTLFSALKYLGMLHATGKLTRCGGWELYRYLLGRPVSRLRYHKMAGNFTEINDWTDDFDYPKDYDNWITRRKQFLEK